VHRNHRIIKLLSEKLGGEKNYIDNNIAIPVIFQGILVLGRLKKNFENGNLPDLLT
jgi:hypothetical protein